MARRKRLVVCFDGTWQGPQVPYVSNVEKLARTIAFAPPEDDGLPQSVLYVSGVGANQYATARTFGGIWGFGLWDNMVQGYRHLALNYDPGDEVFLFGFSRGAFTARSLAGIIGRVGLIRRDALVGGRLNHALERYETLRKDEPPSRADDEFRAEHCHPDASIAFVGVFDTVGALGPRAQFHSLTLGSIVRTARQALAIDDRRLVFDPQLWTRRPAETDGERDVQQVWFEGFHSDIGGGAGPEMGLSNTSLYWMAEAAARRGLRFHSPLLHRYLGVDGIARHDSSNLLWRLDNQRPRFPYEGRPRERFDSDDRRLLDPDDPRRRGRSSPDHRPPRDVLVASSAVERLDHGGYDAPNLVRWRAERPDDLAARTVPVRAFPSTDVDEAVAELERLAAGVD